MAVSSHAASLLLPVSPESSVEMSDSEDCESEDENGLVEEQVRLQNYVDQENNYKMKEVQSRTYQIELLERAKQDNIIICLPTGSGKTYIALELTKYMLPEAIKNQQKIVFVANNRPLVNQQAKYFSDNLSCTALQDDKVVRAITGDLNFDAWKKEQWDEALADCHILAATTKIIVDALSWKFIKWNEIALLILDECHHAKKDHVMAQLMKDFVDHQNEDGLSSQSEIGSKGVPKILGLTATIISTGKSKADGIERDIRQIENTLCCKVYTTKNYEDVLKYSTSTLLKRLPYTATYQRTDLVCKDIRNLVNMLSKMPNNFGEEEEISIIEKVNDPSLTSEEQICDRKKGVPETLSGFLTDLLSTYEELGPYCCRSAARIKAQYLIQLIGKLEWQPNIIIDHNSNLNGDLTEEEAVPNILMLLEAAKTTIFQFIKKLDDWMNQTVKNANQFSLDPDMYKLRHCVSNKIEVLWDILAERKPKTTGGSDDIKEKQLCGIVFCKKRITAQVIRWYLEEARKGDLDFVKPEVILGQSAVVGDVELARFSAKRQEEILKRFKSGELNLLVATQVLEEGIDVPACNLVVRFDRIENYPSFVQSMGRARIKEALCYALIDREHWKKRKRSLEEFEEYNKKLAEVLETKANHVGENDEDQEVDLGNYEDPIPPFKPLGNANGSKVTAAQAVSLISEYCNGLSCDRITTLRPVSWNEVQSYGNVKRFKARVMLPILSPVREIVVGDWMPNKTLAKRSAFLKCYERLWEEGELDEYLLPKRRGIEDFKCDFLEELQNELKEEETKNAERKIGTKKRKQWYRKKGPSIFGNTIPLQENLMPLVYKIDIQISKFMGLKNIENLYKFDNFGLSFGILTNVRLEDLPTFTLKAHFGTFKVSLEQMHLNQETLSSSQLEDLENFQEFLSKFVFGIHKDIFERDPQRPMMIAPLKTGVANEIDWKLIESVLKMEKDPKKIFEPPSEDARIKMEFNPESFLNKLLVPWYKKENELLCTISVMKDLDARSAFPQSKYPSYQKYFSEHHNVELFHPEYPLIHYKAIGPNINFLKKQGDRAEMRKDMRSQSLMVIPELVNVHVLPASLIMQGKFLPSVLHRINRLLVANELRMKVAEHFEWNVGTGNCGDLESESCDISDAAALDQRQLPEVVLPAQNNVGTEVDRKKERNIVLLETINPNNIDWETSSQFGRISVKDTNFSLPEPPNLKSNVCDDLIDIKTVKSYHFDKLTDFTEEKGPSMITVMEALTLSNAQDNLSLEKLEVMGDSVLKLVVSLHIFHSFPNWDEGKMTQLRTKLISNLHLYQIGKKHELGDLLSGSIFVPNKSWLPSGFTIPTNLEEDLLLANELETNELIKGPHTKNTNHHHTTYTHSRVGDKSVADCVEALIGAYFVDGGLDGAFRIMDYLGMRGPLDDGLVEKYSRESTAPYKESVKTDNVPIPFLEDLEEILQYKFRDKRLILEALTHPTFMECSQTRCYERLEFVGDAILDFLMTNYILKETKISDPGKITDLRMALVNNVTFACLTVRYGFHKFLRYYSKLLKNYIDQFVRYQKENNYRVSDPCKLLTDSDCPTVEEIDVPKALGDLFESIAGAVFVDSGNSIDAVWAVFYRLMKNELETFSKNIPKSPLRELYEQFPGKVQFTKQSSNDNTNSSKKDTAEPHFKMVYLKVPKHPCVTGIGKTIKQAKIAAAKYLVRKLRYGDGREWGDFI